jgi:hypothetical protein
MMDYQCPNIKNLKMELDKLPEDENRNILTLMKESKMYWTTKREIINLILKTKGNGKPTIADLQQSLLTTNNGEKINGIINNCLQKSTKRVPMERDPNPDIEHYRLKWS